jgi:dihydroflavonol-4-reductase
MKIAITGASGHLGSVLCRELLNQGHDIVALVFKDISAIEGLPITMVKGDILDKDSLTKLMNGCDALIHSAGLIKLSYKFDKQVYDVNVIGTKNILEIAKNQNISKIIYVSSIHVFSHKPSNEILNETRNIVSDNSIFYDQTKRDAQNLALEASKNGQNIVIVCPTSIVGPYDYKPSKLGKAILDICKGKIPAVVKGGFDFVDVRDLAKGIISALINGKNGENYILGGNYHTIKEFSNMVLKIFGSKKRLIEFPIIAAYVGIPFVKLYSLITKKAPLYDKIYIDILQDGNKYTSSLKAQKELNYKVRPLEETLTETIQWFKNIKKI